MSTGAWEFACPEGTPLPPHTGGQLDWEKHRMRLLTDHLEDDGHDGIASIGNDARLPWEPWEV